MRHEAGMAGPAPGLRVGEEQKEKRKRRGKKKKKKNSRKTCRSTNHLARDATMVDPAQPVRPRACMQPTSRTTPTIANAYFSPPPSSHSISASHS